MIVAFSQLAQSLLYAYAKQLLKEIVSALEPVLQSVQSYYHHCQTVEEGVWQLYPMDYEDCMVLLGD